MFPYWRRFYTGRLSFELYQSMVLHSYESPLVEESLPLGSFVGSTRPLLYQSQQNYDLSVSEAPKLFSDAEFEAVKRIEAGLKVLVLRKRLQVNWVWLAARSLRLCNFRYTRLCLLLSPLTMICCNRSSYGNLLLQRSLK